MPDPSRHADDRNWMESILHWIPGFRGYLDKEYRRESDALARKWMSDRLELSKAGIDECQRNFVDEGRLAELPKIDRLRSKLDKLIGHIRSATQGYSGLFDFVRVKTDLLDQVYQHDVALMKEVEGLARKIEELPTTSDPVDVAAVTVGKQIDEVDRLFGERAKMLEGLGEN